MPLSAMSNHFAENKEQLKDFTMNTSPTGQSLHSRQDPANITALLHVAAHPILEFTGLPLGARVTKGGLDVGL